MIEEEKELIRQVLQKSVEPKLLEQLFENGKLLYVKEGQEIIKPGIHLQHFHIVLRGTIKVMRPAAEDGHEIFMYYLSDKEACAMSITCCMTTRKSEVRAIAEEPSILLLIPIQYVDKWIIEYPTWKSLIFQAYQKRFNDLLQTIDSIAFSKVDERLMNYIERKTKVLKTNIITSTHEEIAAELNSSREVISRLLKQLENMGKVKLGRNKIELL
jgi:CRP/FNR family transcriptional regulator, anaerobic regulatory protein